MTEYKQTFEFPVTIYYEDTDAGGVVYHSNYLKFFERARTELLRKVSLSHQDLLEQNLAFAVRHIDVDFLSAARLDDRLTVKTQLANLKKASMSFCQEIVNPDGKILCKAITKVACINVVKMRPVATPHEIVMGLTNSDW